MLVDEKLCCAQNIVSGRACMGRIDLGLRFIVLSASRDVSIARHDGAADRFGLPSHDGKDRLDGRRLRGGAPTHGGRQGNGRG